MIRLSLYKNILKIKPRLSSSTLKINPQISRFSSGTEDWEEWQYKLYNKLEQNRPIKTLKYMNKLNRFSKEQLENDIKELQNNIKEVEISCIGAADYDYLYTIKEYLEIAQNMYKEKFIKK